VRRDVPRLVGELTAAHPAVQWTARPAIGEVDRVVDAMAEASIAWLQRDP
jgi:sirohydrochlorin ferrochelatase